MPVRAGINQAGTRPEVRNQAKNKATAMGQNRSCAWQLRSYVAQPSAQPAKSKPVRATVVANRQRAAADGGTNNPRTRVKNQQANGYNMRRTACQLHAYKTVNDVVAGKQTRTASNQKNQ